MSVTGLKKDFYRKTLNAINSGEIIVNEKMDPRTMKEVIDNGFGIIP